MNRSEDKDVDDMLPAYRFDYGKAKPNRFAGRVPVTVTLDQHVAEVFTTEESVSKALRALISAMPVASGK
ncbi:MAG: hypothetical protein HYV26_11805 [Candidatus Hydrogenedentes bacterium]|nr:hypothetical protein [Candidatus Hydrogenedentota bacterium]